jgi:hypothetical protein
MSRKTEWVFKAGALRSAKRDGDARVLCQGRRPRTRRSIGCLPDGSGVPACADCAPALPYHVYRSRPRWNSELNWR